MDTQAPHVGGGTPPDADVGAEDDAAEHLPSATDPEAADTPTAAGGQAGAAPEFQRLDDLLATLPNRRSAAECDDFCVQFC